MVFREADSGVKTSLIWGWKFRVYALTWRPCVVLQCLKASLFI